MDLTLLNITGSTVEILELGQVIDPGGEQPLDYISKGDLVAQGAVPEIEAAINADQILLNVGGIQKTKSESLAIMASLTASEVPGTTVTPAHATDHQTGGADEIDVSGLQGVLAQPQKADLTATEVTGVLPVSKGGTGSSTKDFVDLSTNQTIAGVKTFSTPPQSPTAAAAGNDIPNLSQVQGLVDGVSGSWGAPVQDITALKAVAPADRQDKQQRLVENEGANYRYDAQATDAENLPIIVLPSDNPASGRWFKSQAATQDHNTLQNLQGGAPGDYQHLTSSEVANIPSASEKSALAGTSGTPGATNKYVTDSDPRNTDARTPTAHAATHEGGADAITVENLSTAQTDTDFVLKPDGAGGLAFSSGRMTVVPGATAPTQIDGKTLWYNTNNNVLYFYDVGRAAWLSIETLMYSFGEDSADGQYLAGPGITAAGSYNASIVPRTARIIGIGIRARGGNQTKTFQIRVNGSSVASYSLTSREFYSMSLDIPLTAGDKLSVYAVTAGGTTRDVIADIYVKWA